MLHTEFLLTNSDNETFKDVIAIVVHQAQTKKSNIGIESTSDRIIEIQQSASILESQIHNESVFPVQLALTGSQIIDIAGMSPF